MFEVVRADRFGRRLIEGGAWANHGSGTTLWIESEGDGGAVVGLFRGIAASTMIGDGRECLEESSEDDPLAGYEAMIFCPTASVCSLTGMYKHGGTGGMSSDGNEDVSDLLRRMPMRRKKGLREMEDRDERVVHNDGARLDIDERDAGETELGANDVGDDWHEDVSENATAGGAFVFFDFLGFFSILTRGFGCFGWPMSGAVKKETGERGRRGGCIVPVRLEDGIA